MRYKLHHAKCAESLRKDGPGNYGRPGHLSRARIYAPTCFTSGSFLLSTLRGRAATVILRRFRLAKSLVLVSRY